MKVDIIGGGIAGISTSLALKRQNKEIDVTIHEKNKKIGYNHNARKCGEGYTYVKEWGVEKPQKKSIFCEIKKIEVKIGNKKSIHPSKPNTLFTLNKPEFICQIKRKAEKLGVEIVTEDKIKNINELDSDYIVDASGCPSLVKRKLKINNSFASVGYQQTIENYKNFNKNVYKIFFQGDAGYYWIFPRNPDKKEINVGFGTSNSDKYNLVKLLEKFKEKNNITGDINYKSGGLIPMGLQRPLKYKNILFVGDAGVGTFTLWGEGNYRAIISGNIAADCISNNCTWKYPRIINQTFGKWDFFGKTYIKTSNLLKRIGPRAVNRLLETLFNKRIVNFMFR